MKEKKKNKREIEELFFVLLVMTIIEMVKFEQKKNQTLVIKNTCYDRLINYIPKPIRKSVGGFKDKIVTLFKTNTPKQTMHGRGKKLNKLNTQNKMNNRRRKKKRN